MGHEFGLDGYKISCPHKLSKLVPCSAKSVALPSTLYRPPNLSNILKHNEQGEVV